MKELKLKTGEIVNAYQVLDEAKYQKMSDDDKVRLWKISRKLSPIAQKYEEERADANRKLVPSDDFNPKLQKAVEYERLKKEGKEELPMTDEEYTSTLKEFKEYEGLLKKALKDLEEKENEIEIEPLSEEAFGKLMASNDWTLRQVDLLEFIIG